MVPRSHFERPRIWEWCGFTLFVIVVVTFGVAVICRSAFMERRMTDFDVYTSAAWAVRTGHDLYEVTNEDRLHYCYPPTFAVLMTPFAEPTDKAERAGYVPFAVSVGIWYVMSCLFLFAATHLMAKALERGSEAPPQPGERRWWALRMWPMLLTLPGIGGTLSHGQVNLLLLLLLVGCITALMADQSWRAGLWLASAITLKVIPAFLVLVPLARRDRKWLAGMIAGLAALLIAVPAIVIGPSAAIRANLTFVKVMVNPALATDHDASRALEMFHVLRTDNQSTQAVLHALQHWGDPNAPPQPNGPTRAIHWVIGLTLTGITLASMRGPRLTGEESALFFSALIVVMLLVSPMAHLHYYCLTMPLVATLLHREWERRGRLLPSFQLAVILALHLVGGAFPLIFSRYRNLGFAPLTTFPLWVLAIHALWTRAHVNVASMSMRLSVEQRKAA